MITATLEASEVRVGDRVKFLPDSNPRAWWTVKARNNRHVVAVRQAPFQPKDELQYTVTGHSESRGLVRSSLNTLGGGFDLGNNGELAHEVLEALEAIGPDHKSHLELSRRRMVTVNEVVVELTPEECIDPNGRYAQQAARA